MASDMDSLDRFERQFPEAAGKTTMLGLFLPSPRTAIEDPYNLDLNGARLAAKKVMAAVQGLVGWVHARRAAEGKRV